MSYFFDFTSFVKLTMFACFLYMLVNKRLGLGQSLRSVLFCCRLTSTKFNKNSVKCYYRYVKRQVTHHGHYSPVARGWKKGHTPPGGKQSGTCFIWKVWVSTLWKGWLYKNYPITTIQINPLFAEHPENSTLPYQWYFLSKWYTYYHGGIK